MVFSNGDDLPFPHQRLAGTGVDSLGTYELRAGRRYTQAPNIEWVKTYTAMNRRYAQLDPNKVAKVAKAGEAALKTSEGAAAEATAAMRSEPLECVPEVFCEGQMDQRTSVISGFWHSCWRMTARCYKEERFEGDENPKEVWRGQHAYPAPIAELMFQVRDPLAWDKRFELVRLVEDKKLQRGW